MAKKYGYGRAPLTLKQWEQKRQRALRQAGFSTSGPWKNRYKHQHTFWKRRDKVRDPKTAFLYLMDNFMGNNSGKLLESFASRGKYFWFERNREGDCCYFTVRKKGNFVVVTERRWVVNGKGVNTFIGMFTGYEEEPGCVDTVILRHPIMEVDTFQEAYAKAAPTLGFWID